MTQLTVVPSPMLAIATAQAAVANPVAESAESAEAGSGFAGVLRAMIALPATSAPGTEIIAALVPSDAAESAEETAQAGEMPVAADLAALMEAAAWPVPSQAAPVPSQAVPMPSQAAPMPPATGETRARPEQMTGEPVISGTADAVRATEQQPALQAQTEREPAKEVNVAVPRQQGQMESLSVRTAQQNESAITQTVADLRISAAPAAPEPAMPAAPEPATPTAQAQGMASPAHAAKAGGAPAAMRVDTPVGSRGWDAEVGQKIVLMANRHESRAELSLTPPHLGKLDITISVSGEQTSATFVSASPAAREALEQALPRLREMLAEAGISLGQASVNAESARHGRDDPPAAGRGGAVAAGTARADAATQFVRHGQGLIDTFA